MFATRVSLPFLDLLVRCVDMIPCFVAEQSLQFHMVRGLLGLKVSCLRAAPSILWTCNCSFGCFADYVHVSVPKQ